MPRREHVWLIVVVLLGAALRALWVIAAFVFALYAVIGSGYTVFYRYVLPLVPVICLFVGVGLVHAARWLARRTSVAESPALALLVALTVGPALVQCG